MCLTDGINNNKVEIIIAGIQPTANPVFVVIDSFFFIISSYLIGALKTFLLIPKLKVF